MMPITIVFLILALVCAAIATFGWTFNRPQIKINWLAASFLFWLLSILVRSAY
jgi:hypothetical protein